MVQQSNSGTNDIFVASNQSARVFAIANNGDVNIIGNGNYKKNNRDVLQDTSNYVLSTSNILVTKANLNDRNSSNYVSSTSNILVDMIKNNKSSQWTTSNNIVYYNIGNIGVGTAVPSNKLHVYDDISNETKLIIQNNTIISAGVSPTEISVVGATSTIIGTDRCIMFPYADSGLTKEYIITTTENLMCDILIVGGGGGGGNGDGTSNEPGGGGAGGIVYMINKILNIGTYKINVGKGGSANTNGNSSTITDNNNNGLIFDNILLIGKGGGKGATSHPNPGNDGGSGGGGGNDKTNGGLGTQGNTFWDGTTYIAGGNNGGKAITNVYYYYYVSGPNQDNVEITNYSQYYNSTNNNCSNRNNNSL
jgi:hypothetical protein